LNFGEFMRFFRKGLNPFKIKTKFKLDFPSEFYNSKSTENLKLGQKEILFYMHLSATMPKLEIFCYREVGVLKFQTWSLGSLLEKLE
jgi:hypothetical protein